MPMAKSHAPHSAHERMDPHLSGFFQPTVKGLKTAPVRNVIHKDGTLRTLSIAIRQCCHEMCPVAAGTGFGAQNAHWSGHWPVPLHVLSSCTCLVELVPDL